MKAFSNNNNDFLKVLVSTIPSWNQRSGANTFSTLLSQYPAEKLANIYTKAGLPDSDVCSRYFRIIESNVIKSIINRKLQTGTEVVKVDVKDNTPTEAQSEKKRYDFFGRHRWNIFLWIRELLWKVGRWKSKELNQFIDEFQPDVFLFPIESYWYFNRLNKYIIERAKPNKVIAFLWDDNFTYKQRPYSIWARIDRFFTRKQVKELIASSDKILTICPKMKEECDKEYGVDSIIITKPILNTNPSSRKYDSSKPIRIVYSGSLIIGRDKSIAELVKALVQINRNGTKIFLDIYSGTSLSKAQFQALNVPGSSCVHGHIPQQEVYKEQENADILLFVENLNNKFNNVARLSFSTKITDYLSRKRCILAIGPDNIAPMEYLKNENAAITCSSISEIYSALSQIIENPDIMHNYAESAMACGKKNHSQSDITNKFNNILLH